MLGKVFEVKRFAVHDGDGIRTTIFLKGCSLKCVWCHNPESLSPKVELAFLEHKCQNCGYCATVCTCHKMENHVSAKVTTIEENTKLMSLNPIILGDGKYIKKQYNI